ncbi:unnamed protein product, partial [Rotaria magnacalcarata]
KKKISKIEFDFEFRLTCYLFIWLAVALLIIFLAWYRYGHSIVQQLSKTPSNLETHGRSRSFNSLDRLIPTTSNSTNTAASSKKLD